LVIKLKSKRSLYKEFIGALLLALILTGIISFIIIRLTDSLGLTNRHMKASKLIEDIEEKYLDSIDDYFQGIDTAEIDQIQDAFNEMIVEYQNNDDVVVALVSENGELIKSNELVVIIMQTSDMSNVIFTANDDKSNMVYPLIFDKSSMFIIYDTAVLNKSLQRTIRLGDYYLIIYINEQSNLNMVIFISHIIGYFIILFLLVNTRLKYLVLIGDHINKAGTKKELLHVPVKQKNEITYIAKALNRMSEVILLADEEEKAMILSLSHDLRTPLNNIIGYIQLVEEHKYDDEYELNDYLHHIKVKTLYLQEMVEVFFGIIRLSSGQYKLNQENINIIELLRQMVGEYMPISTEKQIELKLFIKINIEQWKNCYCDPTLIRRMFNNLFDNVLKYAEEGSTCEIGLNEEGDIYIFNKSKKSFSNGDLTYLFGKYTRGEDSRTGEGYGLGLYIVGQIVNLHHWSIRCISEEGMFKIFISR
jgi:signal transduction histidine kinase